MIIESFAVGHLGCNCTILGDPVSKKAVVVDPGGNTEEILAKLKEHDLQVTQILHTHAHLDHFLASGELREATEAPLCLHREDQMLWDNLKLQCQMFGIPYVPVPPPDQWIEHEQEITLDQLQGQVLHTPGHSPGSSCFSFPEHQLLIAGDTLFQGSIGRTDLWGGDAQTIERSIRERLYVLDEDTRVITGHGPETTIGYELRHNPFIHA